MSFKSDANLTFDGRRVKLLIQKSISFAFKMLRTGVGTLSNVKIYLKERKSNIIFTLEKQGKMASLNTKWYEILNLKQYHSNFCWLIWK